MTAAIRAEGLRKAFGGRPVLRGVDLEAPAGTVLGVLGPNGAGKTTTVRILTTLLAADAGRASVAGFDVAARGREVRRRIGLTGQSTAVDGLLTARENLALIGRLLRLGRAGTRRRVDALLDRFGLAAAADLPAATLSGGLRRRLDLAACVLGEPAVLFLDEPTTGLDPVSRTVLWDLVRDLVGGGATVLLTTQYLEEADALADRIAVVDAGRVIAEGTPAALKRKAGRDRLEVVLARPAETAETARLLTRLAGHPARPDPDRAAVAVPLPGGLDDLARVAAGLSAAGVAVTDFTLHRPTLDDVFFALTGAGEAEPAA
ncbi:ATP-binding cassette domain-containing protein [Actinomadura atramentaria]|uniref:ATP-binding cassette domain-containing protein n=1 Tax=Actinomadura atramentaria TaxID=1990 RepID=UPI0003676897|nr:ATP-binding cassette domain-containing protein [Actinomadura atramentaria]